jgi:hypothetical protein
MERVCERRALMWPHFWRQAGSLAGFLRPMFFQQNGTQPALHHPPRASAPPLPSRARDQKSPTAHAPPSSRVPTPGNLRIPALGANERSRARQPPHQNLERRGICYPATLRSLRIDPEGGSHKQFPAPKRPLPKREPRPMRRSPRIPPPPPLAEGRPESLDESEHWYRSRAR